MRKALFLLGLATVAVATQAQHLKPENVPAAVKSGFEKHFPNAKELEWEKENANYEAEFKLSGKEYSALLDQTGNLLETEVEISLGELPEQAKAYLKKEYAGKKIEEVAKITDAKNTVTYEVEVGGTDVIFNSAGQYIKSVKK